MNAIESIRLVAGLTGLAIAAASTATFAQTETKAPPTRAEVKEQTRAANKAGQLMPAGEAMPAQKAASSAKTRAERKDETLQARSKGQLKPGGQATYDAGLTQQSATKASTKTRAERKAETQQAAKEGKLMPAGEGEPAKK